MLDDHETFRKKTGVYIFDSESISICDQIKNFRLPATKLKISDFLRPTKLKFQTLFTLMKWLHLENEIQPLLHTAPISCSTHQSVHESVAGVLPYPSLFWNVIYLCDYDSLMETFFCSYPSFQSWPLAPNSLLAVRVGGPTRSTSVRAAASPHEERTCQDTTKIWLTGHWWARWELPWARPSWLSSRTRRTSTRSTSSAGATLGRSCRLGPPTPWQGSRSWRRRGGGAIANFFGSTKVSL